jgi:ketosteroid isomerase-like protein
MSNHPSATEAIVRNHLQAFLEQQGIAAILSDYDDDARFHSEVRTYRGKQEIGSFFEDFIASLPPDVTKRFALRTLQVDGDLAYITWSAAVRSLSGPIPSSCATARSFPKPSRCIGSRRGSSIEACSEDCMDSRGWRRW